jgi:hypothetical protein
MGATGLRSLTGVTRLVTWVFGIGAMLIVIANIAALGWLPGTTANPTCVEAGDRTGPLRVGAHATPSGASVCVDSPSPAQRVADIGDQVPQALFALGALYLLLRFLRTAGHEGSRGPGVPGRLSVLGWFVLIGGPISALLFAVSRNYLRASLVSGVPGSDWLTEWWAAFPWWTTAVGLTALVYAHILRKDHRGAI